MLMRCHWLLWPPLIIHDRKVNWTLLPVSWRRNPSSLCVLSSWQKPVSSWAAAFFNNTSPWVSDLSSWCLCNSACFQRCVQERPGIFSIRLHVQNFLYLIQTRFVHPSRSVVPPLTHNSSCLTLCFIDAIIRWLFMSCRFLHFVSRQEKFGTWSPDWGVFNNGGSLEQMSVTDSECEPGNMIFYFYLSLECCCSAAFYSSNKQLDNHIRFSDFNLIHRPFLSK